MKKLIQVAMVAAALAVAPAAMAAPITGGVSFAGGATPVGGTNFDNATGISFQSVQTDGAATGTYSNVQNNIAVPTFNTITYDPVTPPGLLWSFTDPDDGFTYTFSLNAFSVVLATESFLNITGTGVLTSTQAGVDPTFGTFNLSAQDAGDTTFSFSASNFASPQVVPEPGSMLLLGTGLLGLAAVARRRLRKS